MTKRIELDFTSSGQRELTALRSSLGVSNNSDVIRFALRTFQWLVEQMESGTSIHISRDGTSQEVRFAFLDWANLTEKAREKSEKQQVA